MITSKLTQANTNYSMAFKSRKKKGLWQSSLRDELSDTR